MFLHECFEFDIGLSGCRRSMVNLPLCRDQRKLLLCLNLYSNRLTIPGKALPTTVILYGISMLSEDDSCMGSKATSFKYAIC